MRKTARSIFILVGILTMCGTIGIIVAIGNFGSGNRIGNFSLGLTSPVRLLRYRHEDRYPPYCRRTRILDQIKALAEKAQCQEAEIAIGDAPTRLITCNLPGVDDGDLSRARISCPAQYVALIWQERWPASTENYDLEMYARIRAQCGINADFATFHAAEWHQRAASRVSEQLTSLLDSCRSSRRDSQL